MNTIDYCQFLLSTQVNYTLTYFADHVKPLSHDRINRYLRGERLRPHLVWENVTHEIVLSENSDLVFDDTVLDKRYSSQIEGVRRQYSGNAKDGIPGIGVVSCVYVNPDLNRFWEIDYRLYDPDIDGKTKLQHACEMLSQARYVRQLPFRGVLMDTWYATKWFMLVIERMGKSYYCPLKTNRLVTESLCPGVYFRVDALSWTPAEAQLGKQVHVRDFPKGHRVSLFRLLQSTPRSEAVVEFVITNDRTSSLTQVVQEIVDLRWKVEEFHRETKQTTGIGACQCRIGRIQRNHIVCAILVWNRLKALAFEAQTTIYHLKRGLLDDYLIKELCHPTLKMVLA
ncbi:transposase, IS4 family protein [Candidatus Moduliflexus flocculans]|uniref:Transposase, IS4 family protein n=1 Tax=Candidatus Moduliflexus flocculans TaxID=1499966 RepID=A0A0S6VTD9_9BACT|nr:transposase, IS4 family protein [Candidatus Moduliflexus flocculans]